MSSQATRHTTEIPATLGLRCSSAFASHNLSTGPRVCIARLDVDNCVYENFPRFPTDEMTPIPFDALYQSRKVSETFAETKYGKEIE